ncbi:hypothetical protein AAC387_Pa06g3117 [Persea americana]
MKWGLHFGRLDFINAALNDAFHLDLQCIFTLRCLLRVLLWCYLIWGNEFMKLGHISCDVICTNDMVDPLPLVISHGQKMILLFGIELGRKFFVSMK